MPTKYVFVFRTSLILLSNAYKNHCYTLIISCSERPLSCVRNAFESVTDFHLCVLVAIPDNRWRSDQIEFNMSDVSLKLHSFATFTCTSWNITCSDLVSFMCIV